MPEHRCRSSSVSSQVCVVIPVFNREDLLRECLDSVAAQSFVDWECMIVDDNSTDNSYAVAAEYADRDPRFIALNRPANVRGAAACRNYGLMQSKSPFVMFLDSDDLLHPFCLKRRVSFMTEHGAELDIAVFPAMLFRKTPGDSDKLWNIDKLAPDLLRFLKLDVVWPISGPLWRNSAVQSIGAFEETLPGWQDWQIHVVALLKGLRYVKASMPVDSFVRQHMGEQISESAGSAEHVVAKMQYLLKLMEDWHDRLTADAALRAAAAGLVWNQATQLERSGLLRNALRSWWRVWQSSYISTDIWIEGSMALIVHGKPGGSIAWRKVANWPRSAIDIIDRSTLHKVTCQGG